MVGIISRYDMLFAGHPQVEAANARPHRVARGRSWRLPLSPSIARIPSGLLPDQDSPNAVSDLPRVSSDGRRMSTPMSTSTRKRIAKLRWQGSEGGNSLVKDDGAHAIEAMEASVVSSYSASCSSSNADKEKATDEERV